MNRIPFGISPGELVDRITILEIKERRLRNHEQIKNVRRAFIHATLLVPNPKPWSQEEHDALLRCNEKLWDAMDSIARCVNSSSFGEELAAAAKTIHVENIRRASIKRSIDTFANMSVMEEKSYGE